MEKAAATLTPEEWQNHGVKKSVIRTNKHGETVTRLVDDACIFLNRPGFEAGAGCAFHIAAARRGVNFMTLKPEVCWQLPLRREDEVDNDDGHVTSVIRQWEPTPLGQGRGAEFHWWCTESPEAFVEQEARLPRDAGRNSPKWSAPRSTTASWPIWYAKRAAPADEGACRSPTRPCAGGDGRNGRSRRGRGCIRRRDRPEAADRPVAVRRRSQAGDQSFSPSVVQRVVVGCVRRRGHGAKDLVVLVLFRQAPRSVHVVGLRAALGATSRYFCRRSLRGSALPPKRAMAITAFSRELLVTPGPHLGVPPPRRPDRTGAFSAARPL